MARRLKEPAIPLPPVRKDKAGSWPHASGRVWCLEQDLFGRSGLDRLFAADSEEEVRRLLLEHRYPQKETIEGMVLEENLRLYAFLMEVTPDDGYCQVLLLPRDATNLKISLKAAFAGQAPGEEAFKARLLQPSLIPADVLWRGVIRAEKETALPPWAGAILARAREAYLAGYDPAAIDRSIDRDIHALIRQITLAFEDPWMAGYFDRVRDLANLETLLRVRMRRVGLSVYKDSLLPGGTVPLEAWFSYFDADDQAVIDDLCDTPCQPLSSHFVTYRERGGASRFSLARDKLLYSYLEGGFRMLSGPPRVMAYIMARECEFKNIRIVMQAVTGGPSRGAIGSLRRDF